MDAHVALPVNRMLRQRYAIARRPYACAMARTFGSWLSGPPPSEAGIAQGPDDYPGQRLGLPQDGPRSLARIGRRVAALLIDWLIALRARRAGHDLRHRSRWRRCRRPSWSSGSCSASSRCGCSASPPASSRSGCWWCPWTDACTSASAAPSVRGLLIALVIPALVTDSDLRGLQDGRPNTAVSSAQASCRNARASAHRR